MASARKATDLLGNRPRLLCGLAGAGALALAATGCGVKQGENPNLILGKQQFVAKCGSCHVLQHAGTKGTVGPNLDKAFQHSIEEGLVSGRGGIRGVVVAQVENPNPHGAMPQGLASGAVLNDIASYVAAVAAKPGTDQGLLGTAVQQAGGGKPALEKGGKLEIPADPSGQLSFSTKAAAAKAGAVTIEMPNTSGISHNIAVEAGAHEASGPGPVVGASAFVTKGTASVKVTLKAGTYTFFCQAPGHRVAGMYGTLTVK